MVNKNISTKSRILQILRASSKPVSGEELAASAQISRTAVWKNIQALTAAGYKIDTTRAGYTLSCKESDILSPWEFGANENNFMHFHTTDSTMNRARTIAEEGFLKKTQAPSIITSDFQTQGRGRGKHKWAGAEGALAFTQINRDPVNSALEYRIVAASLIAAAKVLEKLSGRKFYIRWPNDIWSSKGKVAGILDEYSAAGSVCRWINLGIGINLSHRPKVEGADSAFLKNRRANRSDFLNLYLAEYERQKKNALSENEDLVRCYNSMCMDKGKTVVLENNVRAVFDGINAWGWAQFTENKSGQKKLSAPGMTGYKKTKGTET